jgi:hypothetical protein
MVTNTVRPPEATFLMAFMTMAAARASKPARGIQHNRNQKDVVEQGLGSSSGDTL